MNIVRIYLVSCDLAVQSEYAYAVRAFTIQNSLISGEDGPYLPHGKCRRIRRIFGQYSDERHCAVPDSICEPDESARESSYSAHSQDALVKSARGPWFDQATQKQQQKSPQPLSVAPPAVIRISTLLVLYHCVY
ncbi:hypothetical protein BDZ89DRAFT_1062275 [Hymenopellis radicata]|nr:hypothetical protein BDZ89DRAFT_1062275 [Hymenopellis radicata]